MKVIYKTRAIANGGRFIAKRTRLPGFLVRDLMRVQNKFIEVMASLIKMNNVV